MTSCIHKLAGIVAALLVVSGTWVAMSASLFPLTTVDIDHGRILFKNRCASCHATKPDRGQMLGPNLARIATVAESRVPGLSAEEYLVQSIVEPAAFRSEGSNSVMPADIAQGLSRQEIQSLVGYLQSLEHAQDPRKLVNTRVELSELQPEEVESASLADLEAGRKLFLGKGTCSKCHALRETPGFDLRAPSLIGANRHQREFLRESISSPSKRITSGYQIVHVELQSGKQISGRLLRQDHQSLLLLIDGESLETLDILQTDIAEDDEGQKLIHHSPVSSMPSNFEQILNESEINQLVTFLKTL